MIPGAGGYSLNVADTTQQTAQSTLDQRAGGSGNRGFSFGHIGGIGNQGAVGAGGFTEYLPWIAAAAAAAGLLWIFLRRR